jgi:hypothetical protein
MSSISAINPPVRLPPATLVPHRAARTNGARRTATYRLGWRRWSGDRGTPTLRWHGFVPRAAGHPPGAAAGDAARGDTLEGDDERHRQGDGG